MEEMNRKLDRILEFLDIQQHRLTNENSQYSPDSLQKLVADTVRAELRDALLNRRCFDTSSDYILSRISGDGATMFRSDYIPRKYGFMDYDSRYDLFRHALNAVVDEPGILLEFGVFKGGSAEFMARYTEEPIFGFDSFEGLPGGWFSGSQEGRFDQGGAVPKAPADNITFIKGWFDDTLPGFLEEQKGRKIKFIHFDCDLYQSHKSVFDELLKTKADLSDTILLFDEYINFPGWEADAHRALQEFVEAGPWRYRYLAFTPRYTSVSVQIIPK